MLKIKNNRILVFLGTFLIVIVFFILIYFSSVKSSNIPLIKTNHRILFIGNSYTSVNDLPNMFYQLALSGGHKIEKDMLSNGGWTLGQYVSSVETKNKLNASKWDYVVIQEQSQIPSVEPSRSQVMYPAVRLLVQRIRQLNIIPILFMTWGHRDGWVEHGLIGYESMQTQLIKGYMGIANELKVTVAPVGEVWQEELKQANHWNLWQDDNSHPSIVGSYLSACVFYAVIFKESPQGLSYKGGIQNEMALHLQKLAGNIVLNNQSKWNLQ